MKKIAFYLTIAVIVFAVGTAFYRDYQKKQEEQAAIQTIMNLSKKVEEPNQAQTVTSGTATKTEPATEQGALAAGKAAPSFQLTGLDGKVYELKGKREKPVLINFWASWCGPCREEAPALRDLHLKYKDKLDVFAVNIEGKNANADVKAFVNQAKFQMPILLDVDGKVADSYQVLAIPTTYVIDKNGIIRNKLMGIADASTFEKLVKDVIEK